MKTVGVKKLWNGCVSIRDYVVARALNDGGLVVRFDGEQMFLSGEDLLKGKKDMTLHRSKWGKNTYHLIDFDWKPNRFQLELSLNH